MRSALFIDSSFRSIEISLDLAKVLVFDFMKRAVVASDTVAAALTIFSRGALPIQ
jgi:hypothetical protein